MSQWRSDDPDSIWPFVLFVLVCVITGASFVIVVLTVGRGMGCGL